MPTKDGRGFVDYVLWGDDGKPLGLVEAKRTTKIAEGRTSSRRSSTPTAWSSSSASGRSSSTPTATSTGSGTTRCYPPRSVQGFYTKDELELLDPAARLAQARWPAREIDTTIVERYYQERAIRRIAEAFEHDHERKALLVMATGAGKTRTVIALVDLLAALQLGEARPLPRRPCRAGQPGGRRIQDASCRRRRR